MYIFRSYNTYLPTYLLYIYFVMFVKKTKKEFVRLTEKLLSTKMCKAITQTGGRKKTFFNVGKKHFIVVFFSLFPFLKI